MAPWHQVNITFPDWACAEQAAAAHLAPELDGGLATAWWFVRKHPCWRMRYQAEPENQAHLDRHLNELTASGQLTSWTRVVYEPEAIAFGGQEAMTAAHRLFHADSSAFLAYLRHSRGGRHRREISLMLFSVMMRAAGQDLYEQGDAWARVAAHRHPLPGSIKDRALPLAPVSRFITADAETQMRGSGPLGHCARWATAYADAGRHLASLAAAGHLHRGLRDILARHVIFAWNRIGLPYPTQSVLAAAAATAIFGPDPARVDAG